MGGAWSEAASSSVRMRVATVDRVWLGCSKKSTLSPFVGCCGFESSELRDGGRGINSLNRPACVSVRSAWN